MGIQCDLSERFKEIMHTYIHIYIYINIYIYTYIYIYIISSKYWLHIYIYKYIYIHIIYLYYITNNWRPSDLVGNPQVLLLASAGEFQLMDCDSPQYQG